MFCTDSAFGIPKDSSSLPLAQDITHNPNAAIRRAGMVNGHCLGFNTLPLLIFFASATLTVPRQPDPDCCPAQPDPDHHLAPPAQIYRHSFQTPPSSQYFVPPPIGDFGAPVPDRGPLQDREQSRLHNLPQHTNTCPMICTANAASIAGPSGIQGQPVKRSTTVKNPFKKGLYKDGVLGEHTYLICLLPFMHGEGEEPTNDSQEYHFHTMQETQPLLQYLG
ncbi:hypothetical protein C8J57DRAFT_1219563 [Mycena rebaudengoi]|nr:hypothetical protein C8J57DRAFT_1219563 [Mycena rebaudengoi]